MMAPTACSSLLRTGTVVGFKPQHLIVEMSARGNCEQCAQGRGCGLGLLARRHNQHIAIAIPESARDIEQRYPLGDLVTISLPSASVTLLAFFVYGLPLLLALLLSGLVSRVSASIWLPPLIFFIALVGGALSINYLMRGRGERFRPRLVN
ncbi:SoxR reducing system RseC family protein [Halomonas glaciei]|uniref:SoxR reducing system RseC family protein n=3 Tax=Oceanospirillales TaxID=135619 RepID=A0A7Z0LPM8_9GAMM|nr:SoxR reducing system RseC family protein [Halomonas glaciei]